MKLLIQVPCFNEAGTLPATLAELPRAVEGFDSVEWLVIDDGSSDGTAEVAKALGVDHILSLPSNGGLARAFIMGIDVCLTEGADVIVNTDADNQYCAADIPALVTPIVEGRADLVIGDRGTDDIAHFSKTKKRLQRLGSWVMRRLSGTAVSDATSGFRAISRAAALRINILSDFTYTLESLIQAGHLRLAVANVPVRTNPKLRESRLFKGIPAYLARSLRTMGSIYLLYRPMFVFFTLAFALGLFGVGLGIRFLYYYADGQGNGHLHSLLLAVACTVVASQLGVLALAAHLIGYNRRLIEDSLWRLRRLELARQGQGHVRTSSLYPPRPQISIPSPAAVPRTDSGTRPAVRDEPRATKHDEEKALK
jgi:glycosyltransferase involved in cell wall biosynthesis